MLNDALTSELIFKKAMDDQKSLNSQSARGRAMTFCQRYGLRIPILQAPMAGSCPVSLAVAVAEAGGMGAMSALSSSPDAIANWAAEFRSRSHFRMGSVMV
jgi:nitronate monooxygenase